MGGGIDSDGQGYRVLKDHNDCGNQNGEPESVIYYVPDIPAVGEGIFPVVMGTV